MLTFEESAPALGVVIRRVKRRRVKPPRPRRFWGLQPTPKFVLEIVRSNPPTGPPV